jgi:NADPH-dependent ferric siderophore reductase
MASLKGRLAKALGGVILTRATIAAVDDLNGTYRRIVLGGGAATRAGTKLQLLLPSDDMRTYSPVATADGIALLGYRHAGGPGAAWVSAVKVGDALAFIGPQRSLELPDGPVIVVGDETSLAVAWSFEVERPGQVHAVIEAGSVDDSRAAAGLIGLANSTIVARGDVEGMLDAVLAARAASPLAAIGLTGGAPLVIAVRSALRSRGVRETKSKTYWVPGRTGLD